MLTPNTPSTVPFIQQFQAAVTALKLPKAPLVSVVALTLV